MIELETTHQAPVTLGEDGSIRITGSRVALDSIVDEFRRGASAEQIQEDFPTLTLRDIYGAIAYYLSHTESVEAYLRTQEQSAAQTRAEIERRCDTSGLRERLRQRRANQPA